MKPNGIDLHGRCALVTGASRGIGRAIALALGACGADVAVHYAGQEAAAEEVAACIRATGARAVTLQADLADRQATLELAGAAVAGLGKIDILVLNASVQHRRKWNEGFSAAEFDQQVAVNLRSAYELIQSLAPAMVERRWGRVLTIGSVQQYRPSAAMPIYAALKSGLENLVRNLAVQLGPSGVTVNNLSPGLIATDRNAQALSDAAVRETWRERIALKRIGCPEDCAPAAVLLCSDAGAYITGIDLPVDGGLRLP